MNEIKRPLVSFEVEDADPDGAYLNPIIAKYEIVGTTSDGKRFCYAVVLTDVDELNTPANAHFFAASTDMALVLEMLAEEADAGKAKIPSGTRAMLDAALIKAGRKAAPVREGE